MQSETLRVVTTLAVAGWNAVSGRVLRCRPRCWSPRCVTVRCFSKVGGVALPPMSSGRMRVRYVKRSRRRSGSAMTRPCRDPGRPRAARGAGSAEHHVPCPAAPSSLTGRREQRRRGPMATALRAVGAGVPAGRLTGVRDAARGLASRAERGDPAAAGRSSVDVARLPRRRREGPVPGTDVRASELHVMAGQALPGLRHDPFLDTTTARGREEGKRAVVGRCVPCVTAEGRSREINRIPRTRA